MSLEEKHLLNKTRRRIAFWTLFTFCILTTYIAPFVPKEWVVWSDLYLMVFSEYNFTIIMILVGVIIGDAVGSGVKSMAKTMYKNKIPKPIQNIIPKGNKI